MSTVQITAADGGQFSAYQALPADASKPAPGLVLIQEIFGVNHVFRDLAGGFAAQGYAVLCPDLFWRMEPGVDLTDKTEAEWAKAFELMQNFNIDQGVEDLRATLGHLRHLPACSGKAGTVGYCLGGQLAYLMATRSDIDCAVSYYGVGIQDLVDEAANISHPLLMHVAAADEFVPAEAQAKIHEALDGHEQVTIHDYADQNHAFAREGGAHYNEEAAQLANNRTAEFLKQNLG